MRAPGGPGSGGFGVAVDEAAVARYGVDVPGAGGAAGPDGARGA